MSVYVDSSAFAKLYLDEPGKEAVQRMLNLGSPITARHTYVEVRRALYQALTGIALRRARGLLEDDWGKTTVVEIDERVCLAAADIAESTKVKTLDALHLAAAQRAGGVELTFVTFDEQQAQAARSLGWTVAGA